MDQIDPHRFRILVFSVAVIDAIRTLQHTCQNRLNQPDSSFRSVAVVRRSIHHAGPEAARELADSIYRGSPTQFKDLFRMERTHFKRLVVWLQYNAGLKGSRYQTSIQKVMIFLWILAHNESQRNTAHKFQVSQSTVSSIFKQLLPMFVKLHTVFVKPKPDDWLDPDIELNKQLNAFNGCIGAIDGTHIPAHIPLRKQLRWRGHKGGITQNVLAAVRTDSSFSYVLAGAEGSMNDATLIRHALSGGKFRLPPDRYYVADAGFGIQRGIVIPFPNTRYHLQDWRNADKPPESAKELYNLRHSRVRVIVEQTFGMLKRRWKIIRSSAPEYSINDQVSIVYAVTGLHNFILASSKIDQPPPPLTQAQANALRAARGRARRIVFGQQMDRVRHVAAVLMYRVYQRDYQRRRHRQ